MQGKAIFHPSLLTGMPAAGFPFRRTPRDRGVALVIVLSFVVLCTILVVAFFANVTTEGVGERAAASETSASQLALSAVQLVEGTITNATEPQSDTSVAWASQPGMIRTYGGTASALLSDPLNYYKLYSSDNMIVAGKTACNAYTTTGQAAEVPQYWDTAPSLFTDLNAPQTTGPGAPIFPIMDPRATDLQVEGFSLQVKGFSTNTNAISLDGAVGTSGTFGSDSGSRLPMPVRWMYVLRDGTMTVPDTPTASGLTSTAVTSVSWSNTAVNVPTAANPIVGRVAFWTDDESAKVNINTASEGTYWDTPVSNSGQTSDTFTYPQTAALGDAVFANYQGAQHEYQRYPGHPATTCLSSVFGNALSGLGSRAQIVQAITNAIPRVTDLASQTSNSGASSMGGTQPAVATPAPSPARPLLTDLDRLYANLDEFQFTPARGSTDNLVVGSGGQTIEHNLVDTCRFFLTAHSKAPELNLFGLPRVAIWPLWNSANANNRTAFENEILRCSTVDNGINGTGGDPHQMAFFRYDPTSSTNDWNNIPRNQQVYGYLQQLTKRPIPGFGGNFLSQYGSANVDQILTEIFDYVRCTNLADNSVSAASVAATPYTGTRGTGSQANVTVSPVNGALGQVVPIQVNSTDGSVTNGLGRIATIAELGLVLVKVDDRITTAYAENASLPATAQYPANTPNLAQAITVNGAPGVATVAPATQTLVEWALIPKLASPMAGYVALANNIRLKFTKINLVIGGASTTGSPYTDIYDKGRISCDERDSVMGGLIGCETLVESAYQGLTGSPADSNYPTGLCLLSGKSGSPITISGSVEVQLLAPNTASTPLQTFEFTFPAGASAPIPQLYYDDAPPTPPSTTQPSYGWYGTFRAPASAYTASLKASFTYPVNTNKNPTRFNPAFRNYIGGNDSKGVGTDTIRSLVPTGLLNKVNVAGDLRLVALTQTPVSFPTTTFALTLNSSGVTPPSSWYAADCMRCGELVSVAGNSQGALTSQIPVGNYFGNTPEVPPQPSGTKSVPFPGDWDNGPGLMIDGPWANKPDEGMTATTGQLPYIGFYETMVESGAQLSTLFSPNRQISSPVMFGSLPSNWLPGGVSPVQPWRTLLFRPAALLSTTNPHPGGTNATIRDHLLLDLFWMPVVEPYGISEPMATSGKINLNTQIAPFTYITRQTGMDAVLKAVMITALNPSASAYHGNGFARWYKGAYLSYVNPTTTRYPIDATQTLNQLNPSTQDQAAFPEFTRSTYTAVAPNFFVSASQICDVPLIPVTNPTTSASTLSNFWTANSMTGDNSLERPYSMIYPRVTTKSNIFTVHVRAQTLKKIATDANQASWNESKDQVLSDYRGSYTIEKFFDPNTDDITTDAAGTQPSLAKDDASIPNTAALRGTRWRLLNAKRFGQ